MLIPCQFLFFVWGIFGAANHLGCCFKGNVGTWLLAFFWNLFFSFIQVSNTCRNMYKHSMSMWSPKWSSFIWMAYSESNISQKHYTISPPPILSKTSHIIHMGMCYKKHLQCTVCNLMTNLCAVATNAILQEEQGKSIYHFYSLRTTSLQFGLV